MVTPAVVLTKQGLAKIAVATAEKPFKLEKFAVGDGNGKPIIPTEDFTKLVNEKYRDFINSKYAEDNSIVVECVLRANAPITEGFTIRELGIFDSEGTLIAIAKTPESYRPGNKEGVATEAIYSIVLKIENTGNITISLKEGLFATQDALNREIANRGAADTSLDNKITTNKSTIEALKTQVKDLITTLNKYHDRRIGVIFYYGGNNPPPGALKCDGRFVEIAKYPKLFSVIGHQFNGGAEDPKDGTFALPDALNRYLRGASKDKRVGFYEDDAIKKHSHGVDLQLETETFNLVIPAHYHNIADIRGRFWGCGESYEVKDGNGTAVSSGDGAFWTTPGIRFGLGGGDWDNVEYHFSSHKAGVTKTDDGGSKELPVTIKIKHYTGNTIETGAEETRVKGVLALTCIWYE